jgi:hypothetical protein
MNYIWYAAGQCGYWTNDWSKLAKTAGGIPCCPQCGAVGFQCTEQEWLGGAEKLEMNGHPKYVQFLIDEKELCDPEKKGIISRYEEWIKQDTKNFPHLGKSD